MGQRSLVNARGPGSPKMNQLIVEYPDDLPGLVYLTPEELAAQVRLMAAVKMFELGKLSMLRERRNPQDYR